MLIEMFDVLHHTNMNNLDEHGAPRGRRIQVRWCPLSPIHLHRSRSYHHPGTHSFVGFKQSKYSLFNYRASEPRVWSASSWSSTDLVLHNCLLLIVPPSPTWPLSTEQPWVSSPLTTRPWLTSAKLVRDLLYTALFTLPNNNNNRQNRGEAQDHRGLLEGKRTLL